MESYGINGKEYNRQAAEERIRAAADGRGTANDGSKAKAQIKVTVK